MKSKNMKKYLTVGLLLLVIGLSVSITAYAATPWTKEWYVEQKMLHKEQRGCEYGDVDLCTFGPNNARKYTGDCFAMFGTDTKGEKFKFYTLQDGRPGCKTSSMIINDLVW